MSIETNDAEMEKLLLKNGFNQKNIAVMKRAIIQGGEPNDTLYKTVLDLKKRFITGCTMITLFISIFIYHVIAESNMAIIAAGIAVTFAIIATYYITPLNLGYKSFILTRREKITKKNST